MVLSALYHSIRPLPPTQKQLEEEDIDACTLYRYLPSLRGKIAWREIGRFPTPVHRCAVRLESADTAPRSVTFWVKREDLCSDVYGGNKVRTLQHQLASCEAHAETNPGAKFIVVGSGGSNQILATTVHGLRTFGLRPQAIWLQEDAPDMDNTLNMLSTLSFPTAYIPWSQPVAMLRALLGALFGAGSIDKVVNLGGNSVNGVLGQMAGALELAEQVTAGELPDVDALYLPVGSSCTLTGLILGVVLARRDPALRAFRRPAFKIVAVPIHHAAAMAQRYFKIFQRPLSRYVALAPWYGIAAAAKFVRETGGVDLEADALAFLREHVEFVTDAETVGKYGAHSARSKQAAQRYDMHGRMYGANADGTGETMPPIWLCGHFTAKPFSVLLARLEAELEAAGKEASNVIFWQTKSAVQPRGPKDEWERFEELTTNSSRVRRWMENGEAQSTLRPGQVSADSGHKGYRHLMKRVAVPS
ncbi:hypothetical protein CYMTET_23093 [Cymbomonas tetramitiformis]|uniref:Tryptophan synthase beta chain-like PALP domain-containing protein n=1 Tax=Cymbomonas tetramitiformis TaxID=36881 RepID=A0AAE0FYL7_9CHLO|nr:hypothetical protein CYMTET_23093 [Cymbomonas tetramitiformis]